MPEISFIENMSLQETEELVRANYTRIFKELTGQDAELGEADAKNLIIKSFSLVLYQVMQYVEAKGRAELLKTSTGDALDALAALFGITRQEARRATCIVRFTLSGQRSEPTAIPAGTRVKTQDGKYFNTVDYAEVTAGELTVDVDVQAEEAGAESSGIAAGEIDTLVDPIPYVASVESIEASTGGLDIEDDDGLTERVWLAPSKYSCAGPRDAYAYYVKEWRTDVDDVQIVSPEPCVVHVYVVLDGGVLPTETEREELAAYLNGDTIRPLTDIVSCPAAEEVHYDISLTYWIASNDQKSAGGAEDDEGGGTYPCRADVVCDEATAMLTPIATLDKACLAAAKACELCPTVETASGVLRFWAMKVPDGELTGSVLLVGQGGGGKSGDGSYTLPTATPFRLGGVKVGDGLTVDNEGKLSVDAANTEETTGALNEVFGAEDGK